MAIKAYVPVEIAESATIRFEYCSLCNYDANRPVIKSASNLAEATKQLSINNNCRTTSKSIIETFLGFAINISAYYFVKLKYKTTLIAGQPDRNTFYILPLPPLAFKETLSEQQANILGKLYQRMEAIPLSHLDDPKTRIKFEALKTLYKKIAGENSLNATDLMKRIVEHEENNRQALFDLRSPDFFTRFFSLSSATQYAFAAIKRELQQDIDVRSEGMPKTC